MRRVFWILHVAREPIYFGSETVRFDRAKRLLHDSADGFALTPRDDTSATRNEVHHTAKLELNRGKIRIDVRVVELERHDDGLVRVVVQKFRGLVKECGIVFVALEDEFIAAAQAEAQAEVFGNTADKEIRAPPGVRQNPREHGGCRGLSVCSRYDERIVSGEEIFFKRLRKRTIGDFAVQHAFDFRITARQRIAEDDDIRRRIEIGFGEPIGPTNPKSLEQRRSGGIDTSVRAGDAMAALGQHPRERRHGRASDSGKMKMQRTSHGRTAGSRISRWPSPEAWSRA